MVLRNEHLSELAIELVAQAPDGCRQLAVPRPSEGAIQARLSALELGELFRAPVVRPAMAQGVLCGLWLWHDFLEPAHRLAQGDPTVTGSLWHAIMHRRQGDFANSLHWYARCPQ